MLRKKREESGPDLTSEEMEQLVNENFRLAKKYASAGTVSGTEMALETVMLYAKKIGRTFDSKEIDRIKLMAYERGEKALRERAKELQEAGKYHEAQQAAGLSITYGNEAKMLKYSLS